MAVRLDAVADTLSRTTNLPTIASFSMLGWFYQAVDTNTYAQFFAYGNATTGNAFFYTFGTEDDGMTMTIWNGTTQSGSGPAVSLQTWAHMAVVCSGTGAGQFVAYRDGAVVLTHNGSTAPVAQKMWVGGDNQSPNEAWNGRVAAVKIYSAALSLDEIRTEMRCYMPVRTANLNTWSPFLSSADLQNYALAGGGAWTAGGTLTTEDGPPIAWALRAPPPARKAAGAATRNLTAAVLSASTTPPITITGIPLPGPAPPPQRRPWRFVRRARHATPV